MAQPMSQSNMAAEQEPQPKMAAERESLFMLEVVVDEVSIPGITCRYPAVAVRLMDFPTLMIQHADSRLIRKIQINQLQRAELPRQFTELHDENENFAFQKGKSCLFRISAKNLRMHLSNTPLYILVVDTYPEIPKLIASCVLPLCQVIERIYEHIVNVGLAIPETDGQRGQHVLRNLMGVDVGHIVFGYRLISLGEGLLQHVPRESLVVSKSDEEKQNLEKKDIDPDLIPQRDTEPEIYPRKPGEELKKDKRSKLGRSKPEVLDITKVQHIFAESIMNREFANEGTQTDPPKRHKGVATHETEEELVYRPPPLFFNANAEERIPKPVQQSYMGFEYEPEDVEVEEDEPAGIVYQSPRPVKVPRQTMQYADLQQNLAQFPVLSALMNELTRIQGAAFPSENSAFQKVTPTKAKPKVVNKPPPKPQHDFVQENRKNFLERISKPKVRVEKPLPFASPREPVPKTKSWIRKEPEIGVKKCKLQYGMTNTQCLRLAMNNPKLLSSMEGDEKNTSIDNNLLESLANLGQTRVLRVQRDSDSRERPVPTPRKHPPVRHSDEFDDEREDEDGQTHEEKPKNLTFVGMRPGQSSEKPSSSIHIPVAPVSENEPEQHSPFPGFKDEEDDESYPIKDENVRDSLMKMPVINPKASKNSPISSLRTSQAFTARSEAENPLMKPMRSVENVRAKPSLKLKSVSFEADDTTTKASSEYEPSFGQEPPRRPPVRPVISEESLRTESVSSYTPTDPEDDQSEPKDSEYYSDDFEVDIPMSPTYKPSLPRVSHMGYTY